MKGRAEAGTHLQLRPVLVMVPDLPHFPMTYIMNFSIEEIAKQMTLIDYGCIHRIQVSYDTRASLFFLLLILWE